MAVVFITDKVSKQDIEKASEDYGEYIKIVVEVEKQLMAIGGQWHADAEKVVLDKGGNQDDIWGGGIDLVTKNIETVALINLRPRLDNNSQEILDKGTREEFIKIVKNKFQI